MSRYAWNTHLVGKHEMKRLIWFLIFAVLTSRVYAEEKIMVESADEFQGPELVIVKDGKLLQPKRITWEKDGTEMVRIPAGSFQMGDSKHEPEYWMTPARPLHTVELNTFYMDTTEVTVGQFMRFVEQSGYDYDFDQVFEYGTVADFSPTDKHPMVYINWFDAIAYAKWAGKRLPTEAEWEKAARAGLVSDPVKQVTVKASHILIQADSDVTSEEKGQIHQEAFQLLQNVRSEIGLGKTFAELAKIHSDCPSASNGGQLGAFGRGKMVKPFETVCFDQLDVGQISGLVETDFGFHIIKLEDKKIETNTNARYVWGNNEANGGQCNYADKSADAFLSRFEWYRDWADMRIADGFGKCAPVGSYAANGYGLYDMAGNVYEWCSDWYADNYYSNSPMNNPRGPAKGKSRVLRGGSWAFFNHFLRVAYRGRHIPLNRRSDIGFRCVSGLTN